MRRRRHAPMLAGWGIQRLFETSLLCIHVPGSPLQSVARKSYTPVGPAYVRRVPAHRDCLKRPFGVYIFWGPLCSVLLGNHTHQWWFSVSHWCIRTFRVLFKKTIYTNRFVVLCVRRTGVQTPAAGWWPRGDPSPTFAPRRFVARQRPAAY